MPLSLKSAWWEAPPLQTLVSPIPFPISNLSVLLLFILLFILLLLSRRASVLGAELTQVSAISKSAPRHDLLSPYFSACGYSLIIIRRWNRQDFADGEIHRKFFRRGLYSNPWFHLFCPSSFSLTNFPVSLFFRRYLMRSYLSGEEKCEFPFSLLEKSSHPRT